MSIKITDDCINCGACVIECPVNAIYPKAESTSCKEPLFINNVSFYSGFASTEHYYINPNECNSCISFFNAPKCNDICPVACCLEEEKSYDCNAVNFKSDHFFINKISLN